MALAQPSNVLVIYSNGRLLPANIEFDRGLTLSTGAGGPALRVFSEFLDAPLFWDPDHEARSTTYLREKYAKFSPRVVIGAGNVAMEFLLRQRDRMFPRVPLVFVGHDRAYTKVQAMPPDVVAIPANADFIGTLAVALQLQPDAKRVVVVTGAGEWDHNRERELRRAIPALALPIPVRFVSGLGSAALAKELRALPPDSIVLTPGYFTDGDGQFSTAKESAQAMAAVSSAPIYAPYHPQLGVGVVGGHVTSFVDIGVAARRVVEQIVSGDRTDIPPTIDVPAQTRLDWRQLQRWRIAADRIPGGAVVEYRAPSLWEAHRNGVLAGALVIALQGGMIGALLFQRRRRKSTSAALSRSEGRLRLATQAAQLTEFGWSLAPYPGPDADRSTRCGAGAEPLPSVLARVHPADRERVVTAVHRAAADGSRLDVEYRIVPADGDVQWFVARGEVLGDAPVIAGLAMEVTSRKRAELQAESDRAALTHMSRVATMGQMSAAIAHQLNQPLAAILGNAETARRMLGREGASIEEVIEILDDIISEDNRAAEIIRRLGALYKRGEVDFSTLDLNQLIRETLELMAAQLSMRHVVAELELDAAAAPVRGSKVQLQQVLLNLIMNASDAMTAVPEHERRVVVRTVFREREVETCVIDEGTGIAAGQLERIFEPFWTTKSTGVGVGLAICNAIVLAHHGRMNAANNRRRGASLCFVLPAAAPS